MFQPGILTWDIVTRICKFSSFRAQSHESGVEQIHVLNPGDQNVVFVLFCVRVFFFAVKSMKYLPAPPVTFGRIKSLIS